MQVPQLVRVPHDIDRRDLSVGDLERRRLELAVRLQRDEAGQSVDESGPDHPNGHNVSEAQEAINDHYGYGDSADGSDSGNDGTDPADPATTTADSLATDDGLTLDEIVVEADEEEEKEGVVVAIIDNRYTMDWDGAIPCADCSAPLGWGGGGLSVKGTATGRLDARPPVQVAPNITTPYKRPSGATTPEQHSFVQGKPCVDCGKIGQVQRADHIDPLVKEYYRTGDINMDKMRSLEAVQPQCGICSAKQGGRLSGFSKKMKDIFGLD